MPIGGVPNGNTPAEIASAWVKKIERVANKRLVWFSNARRNDDQSAASTCGRVVVRFETMSRRKVPIFLGDFCHPTAMARGHRMTNSAAQRRCNFPQLIECDFGIAL